MKRFNYLLLVLLLTACAVQKTAEMSGGTLTGGTEVPPVLRTLTPSLEESDVSTIRGALFLEQVNGEEIPVVGVLLYLAEVLTAQDGTDSLAALDKASSPRAVTTEEGAFEFRSVATGKYGLVLDLVSQSFILMNPQDGETMLISIEDQKTIDLGKLIYPSLPLPPDSPSE